MTKHETFSHPSEEGVRGYGDTVKEAFEEAAKALESIILNLEDIEQNLTYGITIQSEDREQLLVKWLNELVYLFEAKKMVFNDFNLEIKDNKLKAQAMGERFDSEKHQGGSIIKAVTYNELKVERQKDKWIAQCIVDV